MILLVNLDWPAVARLCICSDEPSLLLDGHMRGEESGQPVLFSQVSLEDGGAEAPSVARVARAGRRHPDVDESEVRCGLYGQRASIDCAGANPSRVFPSGSILGSQRAVAGSD